MCVFCNKLSLYKNKEKEYSNNVKCEDKLLRTYLEDAMSSNGSGVAISNEDDNTKDVIASSF